MQVITWNEYLKLTRPSIQRNVYAVLITAPVQTDETALSAGV